MRRFLFWLLVQPRLKRFIENILMGLGDRNVTVGKGGCRPQTHPVEFRDKNIHTSSLNTEEPDRIFLSYGKRVRAKGKWGTVRNSELVRI